MSGRRTVSFVANSTPFMPGISKSDKRRSISWSQSDDALKRLSAAAGLQDAVASEFKNLGKISSTLSSASTTRVTFCSFRSLFEGANGSPLSVPRKEVGLPKRKTALGEGEHLNYHTVRTMTFGLLLRRREWFADYRAANHSRAISHPSGG
jgi:hypothetical protein